MHFPVGSTDSGLGIRHGRGTRPDPPAPVGALPARRRDRGTPVAGVRLPQSFDRDRHRGRPVESRRGLGSWHVAGFSCARPV